MKYMARITGDPPTAEDNDMHMPEVISRIPHPSWLVMCSSALRCSCGSVRVVQQGPESLAVSSARSEEPGAPRATFLCVCFLCCVQRVVTPIFKISRSVWNFDACVCKLRVRARRVCVCVCVFGMLVNSSPSRDEKWPTALAALPLVPVKGRGCRGNS